MSYRTTNRKSKAIKMLESIGCFWANSGLSVCARKLLKPLVAGYLVLFTGQFAFAEQPVLKPFPLSQVVENSTTDLPEYRLVTGRMSSIGAVARPEQQEIISGQVNKVTYEVPKVHTPQEVMEYYRGLISSLKGTTIFSCESRDCGRSNDWANEVFNERILYGHDRFQYYTVASFNKENASYVAVIYTIRRGNQRVYAHLEIIKLAEPFLDDDESSDPFIQIANNELSETRAMEDKLTPWLEKIKTEFDKPRIVIVSYSRQEDVSAAKNLENAREQGRTMQLYLARQAFSEDQIDVIPVGPFAPRSLFDEHPGFVRIFAIDSE